MAFTGQNPRFTTSSLTDLGTSGSTANPQSGSHKVVDRNGVLFLRDSSGNEAAISSGSGEVNNILSPNTSSGWTASGAGVTVATTSTSSDLPLAVIIPTALKVTPVSGTDYAYYRFTLPNSLLGAKQKLAWFQRPLSGYASGDLKVDVYTNSASNYGGTYTRVALSGDVSSVSSITSTSGYYYNSFTANSTDLYYEVRIVRVAGTTAANFADIIVGPSLSAVGSVIGDYTSWTPTGSFTSNTTYTGSYQQFGTKGKFKARLAFSGAPNATSLTVNMPSGLTIDTAKLFAEGWEVLGIGSANDSGTQFYRLDVRYNSSTSVTIAPLKALYGESTNNLGYPGSVDATHPFTFGSGDFIDVEWEVPVAEWASSGIILRATDTTRKTKRYSMTLSTFSGVSGTSYTVYAVAYRDSQGNYYCDISGQISHSSSNATFTVDFEGISPSPATQTLAAARIGTNADEASSLSFDGNGTGGRNARVPACSNAHTRVGFSGVLNLGTNKPDWFDANLENALDASIYLQDPVTLNVTTSSNAAGTGTPAIFTSVVTDSNSGYNVSNGRYTVPVAGTYVVAAQLQSASNQTATFYLNGTLSIYGSPIGSSTQASQIVVVKKFVVGDIVDVRPDASVTLNGSAVLNFFSMVRIGT